MNEFYGFKLGGFVCQSAKKVIIDHFYACKSRYNSSNIEEKFTLFDIYYCNCYNNFKKIIFKKANLWKVNSNYEVHSNILYDLYGI